MCRSSSEDKDNKFGFLQLEVSILDLELKFLVEELFNEKEKYYYV